MSLQDTIKKFQTLPPDIQQALSSDEAMARMEALESKYNLKLASFVLRAAVRSIGAQRAVKAAAPDLAAAARRFGRAPVRGSL